MRCELAAEGYQPNADKTEVVLGLRGQGAAHATRNCMRTGVCGGKAKRDARYLGSRLAMTSAACAEIPHRVRAVRQVWGRGGAVWHARLPWAVRRAVAGLEAYVEATVREVLMVGVVWLLLCSVGER